jgi:sec-independent protein translocase protein TatB
VHRAPDRYCVEALIVFDIGFSELIVIAIVALVVIGPERLPKVARTAGLLLGRLQRYVNDVKADINREMQLDELKTLRSELQESARSLERQVSAEINSVEQLAKQTAESVADAASSPAESAAAGAVSATVPSVDVSEQSAVEARLPMAEAVETARTEPAAPLIGKA